MTSTIFRDARNVSNRIRSAHVLEHTWDDWDDVLNNLYRMQRVMAGGRTYGGPYGSDRGWRR